MARIRGYLSISISALPANAKNAKLSAASFIILIITGFYRWQSWQHMDKLLERHNLRCVSCKSCSHACPYGTIYPELVPLLIRNCDFCLDRQNKKNEPLCIQSCSYSALSLKDSDAKLDENNFLVGDNLIVHSAHWDREKA